MAPRQSWGWVIYSTSMLIYSSIFGTILNMIVQFHRQIYLLQTSLPLERRPTWFLGDLSGMATWSRHQLSACRSLPSIYHWPQIERRSSTIVHTRHFKVSKSNKIFYKHTWLELVLPDWTGINSRMLSLLSIWLRHSRICIGSARITIQPATRLTTWEHLIYSAREKWAGGFNWKGSIVIHLIAPTNKCNIEQCLCTYYT